MKQEEKGKLMKSSNHHETVPNGCFTKALVRQLLEQPVSALCLRLMTNWLVEVNKNMRGTRDYFVVVKSCGLRLLNQFFRR